MELNKQTVRQIYKIIAFSVFLFVAVQNFDVLYNGLRWLLGIFSPVIFGLAMAFVMNVPMSAIERTLFSKPWRILDGVRRKGKRGISILLTILLFFGVIVSIFFTVIPEIARSLSSLATQVPVFLDSLDVLIKDLTIQYPQIEPLISGVSFDIDTITKNITGWLSTVSGDLFATGLDFVQGIFSKVSTLFIAFFLHIYVLATKETLGRQSRAALYAILPENRADSIINLASISNKTYSRFISGQVLEALLLALLTLITNLIFNFPYAFLIAVIMGVMALVPIFGAIIAAAVGMLLIAIVNPYQAILFLIVNIVVQQIDNNLIYPRTVGGSIGLPGMWVLIASAVGGNYGGVLGILITIPLVSVVYVLVRTYIYDRIKVLKIPHYKIKH